MFLCSANIFAANIGRAVYGVLTETYNGVDYSTTTVSADSVDMHGSGYDNTDKVEGSVSTSVGYQYWFGICFRSPQDMSCHNLGRLYFSAKVPTTVNINDTGNVFKVSDGTDRIIYFNSTNIKRIDNGSTILDTGIKNDNLWHTYYIPLSAFTGLQLANITYLFIVGSSVNDNTLLIDHVYWTRMAGGTGPERTFDVKVKNISDNAVVSTITWNQSCYRQSWKAADQYIELDLDYESTNWYVRVYLDNEKASRNGLYCIDSDGSEIIFPMAWRIRPDLLPNSSGDTLIIARHNQGSYGLYDYGKHPDGTDWYTWCPMREKLGGLNFEDVKVWNLSGIHTVVWDHDSYDTLRNYYERKPKIYFAADFSNAIGGLTYTANVVVELVFE